MIILLAALGANRRKYHGVSQLHPLDDYYHFCCFIYIYIFKVRVLSMVISLGRIWYVYGGVCNMCKEVITEATGGIADVCCKSLEMQSPMA